MPRLYLTNDSFCTNICSRDVIFVFWHSKQKISSDIQNMISYDIFHDILYVTYDTSGSYAYETYLLYLQ